MKKIAFSLCAVLFLMAFTTENKNDPGGKTFTIQLSGSEEVTPGDPDGTGMATITLNQGQGTISYQITVSGIETPMAAHIHEAPAGQAGPVVFTLATPVNGVSSGVIRNVSKEMIKEIRQNPEDYYINVHNAMYPAGALRGQLSH